MKQKSSSNISSKLRLGYSDSSVYTFKIRLVALISIFAIYIAPLFFALSGLVGFEYGGKEESSVYVYYVVFFLMAILMVYLRSFAKKSTMCKTEIGFYFFFLFLIIINPANKTRNYDIKSLYCEHGKNRYQTTL